MHFDFSLTGILFGFTIFGLLLTKLMQVSRSFIIPYLLDEIKQERAARTELIEKENFITSTQRRIETQLRNQKQIFDDLENNIHKWHSSLEQRRELVEQDLNTIKNKIEQKRDLQCKNYTIMATYKTIVPKAIELARHEMLLRYSTDEGCVHFCCLIEKLK